MQNRLFIDKHDLSILNGTYLIQICNDDFRQNILDSDNLGFWEEKRICFFSSIEGGWFLAGFSHHHSKILSSEEMVKKINEGSSDRHYRIMLPEEVEMVISWKLKQDTTSANRRRDDNIEYHRKKKEREAKE